MLKNIFKWFLFFALIVSLIYVSYANKPVFVAMLRHMQMLPGYQLILCFCLLYIVSNLLLLPFGLPMNMFAGLTWGTLGGGIMVNLLATFVAALSFILARRFKPVWLDNYLAKKPFLVNLKSTINRYDWQFISMARINPVVPFSLSNYLFGLIPELSFRHYLMATVLSNFLPCFMFAAIGSMVNNIYIEKNSPASHFIFDISIVLLLLSTFATIKMLLTNKGRKFHLNKEIA